VIEVRDLRVCDGPRIRLSGVTFDVESGSALAVIGPSGAGKSTLLRALVGLEPIVSGVVKAFGHDATQPAQWRDLRQTVGYCFQDFQLFPHLSALDNVALALKLTRRDPEARDKAKRALARFDAAAFADQLPSRLSGGQKQRVALARAMVLKPRALLLDEPVSALDPERVAQVIAECRSLREEGITLVVTSHHLPFARAVATDVLVLEQGRVARHGKAKDILLEQ
jgi:polar amino acid transport system ATP-binding protein